MKINIGALGWLIMMLSFIYFKNEMNITIKEKEYSFVFCFDKHRKDKLAKNMHKTKARRRPI
jgi:hypothetical protein